MYALSVFSQYVSDIFFCENLETMLNLVRYYSRDGKFPSGVTSLDPVDCKIVLKSRGRKKDEAVVFIACFLENETVKVIHSSFEKGTAVMWFESAPAKIVKL